MSANQMKSLYRDFRIFGVKVVTYSRVSTSHHDQNPEVRVHELRWYCTARGFEVVYEIFDHGCSGDTDNRLGFKSFMQMVRRCECDGVVITKPDCPFPSLMDRHLPNWRHIRDELNRLPVPYGEWN